MSTVKMRIKVDATKLAEGMRISRERLEAGIRKAVADATAQAVREAKENLKGDARAKHLMQSIHFDVRADGARAEGRVGVGGATDIEGEAGELFGIYVHEGTGIYSRTGMGRKEVPWFYLDAEGNGHTTSGMQANPFLENAYNSVAGQVQRIMAAALLGGV